MAFAVSMHLLTRRLCWKKALLWMNLFYFALSLLPGTYFFYVLCRCRTHAAVRFPPYTPFKTFLIKIFSLHAVSDFVNVPVPMFRMLCKAAIAYGIATALGVSVSFTETPVTEYIKSFFF